MIDTRYAIHVFDAVAGAINGMSVNVTALTVVDAIAVTVRVSVPGPVSCTMNWHVPGNVVPVVRHVDAGSSVPSPVVVAVNVVPSDAAPQSASVGFADTRRLHRRRERVRHAHQVRRVGAEQHPELHPCLRRRQRHRLVGCLTGRPAVVRSTSRPPLSVRLVTVNVPVPAVGDVTLTVHMPWRSWYTGSA